MNKSMVIEEETYKGHNIIVGWDEFADENDNPRNWDGNLTTMACFHTRYTLGDQDHGYCSEDYDGWNEMELSILRNEDILIMQELHMYDHSGITISTNSCEHGWYHAAWDSGQIGFVYITRQSVMKVMNWKRISQKRRKWLIDQLLMEVKIYDQYLRGELYVLEVVHQETDEVVECYGGIFGESDQVLQDAKAEIDHYH